MVKSHKNSVEEWERGEIVMRRFRGNLRLEGCQDEENKDNDGEKDPNEKQNNDNGKRNGKHDGEHVVDMADNDGEEHNVDMKDNDGEKDQDEKQNDDNGKNDGGLLLQHPNYYKKGTRSLSGSVLRSAQGMGIVRIKPHTEYRMFPQAMRNQHMRETLNCDWIKLTAEREEITEKNNVTAVVDTSYCKINSAGRKTQIRLNAKNKGNTAMINEEEKSLERVLWYEIKNWNGQLEEGQKLELKEGVDISRNGENWGIEIGSVKVQEQLSEPGVLSSMIQEIIEMHKADENPLNLTEGVTPTQSSYLRSTDDSIGSDLSKKFPNLSLPTVLKFIRSLENRECTIGGETYYSSFRIVKFMRYLGHLQRSHQDSVQYNTDLKIHYRSIIRLVLLEEDKKSSSSSSSSC